MRRGWPYPPGGLVVCRVGRRAKVRRFPAQSVQKDVETLWNAVCDADLESLTQVIINGGRKICITKVVDIHGHVEIPNRVMKLR